MKKTLISALLLTLLGAGSAFALDLTDVYGGVTFGSATGIPVNNTAKSSTEESVGVFVGKYFTPSWRAELTWEADTGRHTDYHLASATAGYRYVVNSDIAVIGNIGETASTLQSFGTSQDWHWAPMVGVTAEYALSPRWALRADYKYVDSYGPFSHTSELTSLGLQAKF